MKIIKIEPNDYVRFKRPYTLDAAGAISVMAGTIRRVEFVTREPCGCLVGVELVGGIRLSHNQMDYYLEPYPLYTGPKPDWTADLVAEARNPMLRAFCAFSIKCQAAMHLQEAADNLRDPDDPNIEELSDFPSGEQWRNTQPMGKPGRTILHSNRVYRIKLGFDPLKPRRMRVNTYLRGNELLVDLPDGSTRDPLAMMQYPQLNSRVTCSFTLRSGHPIPVEFEVDEA